MNLSNITKAWKSTLLASVLLIGLGFAVAFDKVTGGSDIVMLLGVILAIYPTDIFSEEKQIRVITLEEF